MNLLLTELRRSTAPVLFAGVSAMGVILLFVHPEQWVGRWSALACYLRTDLILVVPLCAAVAAWQGGRERRRGLVELLGATPRPGWTALFVTWAALSAAATAGLLVTFAVATAFVAPHATYSGGGWWWVALGCLPAVAAALALGLAVGRWVPSSLVGLPLAVALYVVQALPGYADDPAVQWLDPMLDGSFTDLRLPGGTSLLQAAWFGGLAVTLLGIAALRSAPTVGTTPLAALAAGLGLALAGGVPLADGQGRDRWIPDPAAQRPVCAPGTPRVCLAAVDAYLLDDITPPARRALARLAGVPGAPTWATGTWPGLTLGSEPPADALALSMLVPDLRGHVVTDSPRWADPVVSAVQTSVTNRVCLPDGAPPADWETQYTIEQVVTLWVLQRAPDRPANPDPDAMAVGDPTADRQAAALANLARLSPADQRAWLGRVYATRDSCDAETQRAILAVVEPR